MRCNPKAASAGRGNLNALNNTVWAPRLRDLFAQLAPTLALTLGTRLRLE